MDHSDRGGLVKRERSWNVAGDSPNSKRPAPVGMPSTLRVLLRSIDAGGIIGKGGENIKRMRKKYDCQVQLPDSAGNPERVLTVIGDRDNCVGVFEECLEKVKNEIKRRDMHAPIEVQVLIPQPFMGTIIGTGGMKIKELRKRTNCNIKIFSEPMPFSNERSISLSGTEEEIIECVSFFLQEIGQREPKEPIILYDPSVPPDMPPPFDYPPQYGYGRGRGRGGGRGGRMYNNGRGNNRGGHNFRGPPHQHHHQTPPPHQSGPPPSLVPPSSETTPTASSSSQDNTSNTMPPPPPTQQPPLVGQQQQVRTNQSGQQLTSLFTQQGPPPPQTVQYPSPVATNQPPPAGSGGPPSFPPPTRPPPSSAPPSAPPTTGLPNPPQGYGSYAPPPNPPPGTYAPTPPQPPVGSSVLPSPLVNQPVQPPPTQYPQPGTLPPPIPPPNVPQQTSYPALNQPPPTQPSILPPSQYQNAAQDNSYSAHMGYGASQANYATSYSVSQPSYATSQTNSYAPSQSTGYSAPYQQSHPTYPPPQAPPTPVQPPYYGGTGQYQTPPPNPVFPAASAMQTGANTTGYQPQSQSTEQQTKQVTIPHEFASAILGPGGSKLQQIRTQSRCSITMDEIKPNSTERVITIVGGLMDIAMAEQLMKDSVRQQHKV